MSTSEENHLDGSPSSRKTCRHAVLVHGTWGNGILRSWFWDFLQRDRPQRAISSWFWDFLQRDRQQRDIKCKWPIISEALKEAGATLHWFPWSGRNSHARRIQAGEQLATLIDSLRKDPSDQVFIIAHSHGGNVALYSLKHVEPVDGIVFLATPFLQFDPQRFDFADFRFLPFAVAYTAFTALIAPVLLLWFGTIQLVMLSLPGVVVGLACVIGVIGFSAAGLFATRLTYRWLSGTDAKRLRDACTRYQPTVPERQRVLILRKAVDEASAILSAGLFLEWLLAPAWRAFACLARLPHTGSVALKELFRRYTRTVMTLLASSIAVLIISTKWTVWLLVLAWLAGAVSLVCLLQLLLLFFVLFLNTIRFGRKKSVIQTSLIRVVSEATPLGEWKIELFSAKRYGHSEIYNDPETAKGILRWLLSERHGAGCGTNV